MLKKSLSILISAILLISLTGISIFAFANDNNETDNSALVAALNRVESYNEEDYTPESYGALYNLYETYSAAYESYTTQAEIDSATAQLLEAISDLMAYLNLDISANIEGSQTSVSFGSTTGGAGKYTVVYSTPITLFAPAVDGYTFAGWFETVSNRMLSSQSTYSFKMSVNTSLKAIYYSNSKSTLTFKSCSGQIVSVTEKTAEEWAQCESISEFIPASVPYRYGYSNGSWNVSGSELASLISGQSVVVTPVYESGNAVDFDDPQLTDSVNLKLYYRFDSDNNVGSFIMKTADAQNITPDSVGMLFVYKKAANFDPTTFDVNINNRQIVSQFDDFSDNVYITNINKMTGNYNYAVKGYYVYNNGEKQITVYSNQVNVVNRSDVHNLINIEAVAPTCTETGNTSGTYCETCGEYFGVEEIAALGHNYESVVTAPTCTEQGYTTYTCSRCNNSYDADYVNALGHNFVAGEVVAPTCTTNGYTVYNCSRCDATENRDETSALGHILSGPEFVWASDYKSVTAVFTCEREGCTDEITEYTNDIYFETTPATCTADGTTTYIGTFANESMPSATITVVTESALGHNYESVVTQPTCTTSGYTTYTCSRCQDSYTDNEVSALGHEWGEIEYSWASDNKSATAQRCCTRANCTEKISETVKTTSQVTKEPTCTEPGETTYSALFTNKSFAPQFKTVADIPALGHNYESAVTQPTCTEQGYTTYTCSRCNDSYVTDYVPANGHTPQAAVEENTVNATCTANGSYDSVVYCSVCNAELSRTPQTINALGHNFGEWTVTTAAVEATCTAAGATAIETRYCSRCDATEATGGETVAALGHNYTSVVTAPTCTEGGYTTHTCSRCGDSYTSDNTAALGHNYGNWAVTTGATLTTNGVETKTCANDSSHTQTRTISNFTCKLVNKNDYLYRVGNANNVALGTLFDNASGADITSVTATVTKIAGTAGGTFTANSSDWRQSTVKFSGTGVVTLTLKHGTYTAATLNLEVVAGTNYAAGATLGSVTSNNAVLLGNVNSNTSKTNAITINNNKTLYGNGFSVTDVRTSTATTSGYINMSGGGAIDNAVLLGQVYSNAVSTGTNNECYAPGIWVTGNAGIYNSRVSECKYAVQVDGGDVTLENSTFDGGAIANVCIGGGNVTLKNCTTSSSVRGGLNGLGIRATTTSCKINIEGSLTQYNWLKKSDLPSTYSSVLSSIYNDSTYAYSYSGSTYVNMGIFFITDASAITQALAQEAINDKTSNNYGYIEKSAAGITGTVYTAKSSMGSASMLTTPTYTPVTNGQYYTLPTTSFNYTMNDFSTDDTTYCTYNSTTKTTNISFVQGSSVSWNTSILTVTKNGSTLPYTVTMNNTDYTGQSITFNTAGDYEVVYSYTDPYNYDENGTAFNHTYTKTVNIHVATVEQGATVYHPDFTYANIGGTTASRQVTATVSGANRVYVMPDVSATSSTIESKTVGGQTIYYPVVSVPASNSSGGNFSSGQLYYFAPAFKHINIVDYDQNNQTTKTAKYTYNTSTQKWPHNVSSSSKPNDSYYYYTATGTSTNTNRPYGRSMNEQYYGYTYISSRGGLCFSSNQIEKQNDANSQLVEFYYKGTDDITYYYYIKYSFAAATGSCVAEGSLVTMADGTQKPIEDVKQGDMVMTWSMWNGRYEAQPVALAYYHSKKDWDVLTLNFSDGTDVRMINQHGFFDVDKNTYAYITPNNVDEYIGDRFIKQLPDGTNTEVTLDDYTLETENVGCYSLQTAYNENFMVENMLSMTGEDYTGRFEYFDIGEGMKYDEAKMQADIDRYGLYTYEDWSDYLTPMQFEMFNGKYFKILVGKGVLTREDIVKIIEDNLK